MGIYIEEFDHLIELAPTTEVKKYDDDEALSDRISEWLETPQGTVADLPAWGHNLSALKHEPQGVNFEVVAEMSITAKMPQDIADLIIMGVDVKYADIDLFYVSIRHRLGIFEESVSL